MKPSKDRKQFWKKLHRWGGLAVAVLILVFCISGIILNHRNAVREIDVNRNLLPSSYRIQNFNNGVIKGTLSLTEDSVLAFGSCGVWLTDKKFSTFEDFNKDFQKGTDNRNIKNIVKTKNGEVWCAAQYGLYKLADGRWTKIYLPGNTERLSDVTLSEDSCRTVAVTRSQLYVQRSDSLFEPIAIPHPDNYTGKVSLFKTVWHLHSGELFGLTGKIVVDIIALILVFLSITGIIIFILPYNIRRLVRKKFHAIRSKALLKWNFKWHNSIGWYTFPFVIIIVLTGMCLRPPLMIPFVISKTAPIPGTDLDNANCWYDKLRALRWDEDTNAWLLSTSEGFYRLDSLSGKPTSIDKENTPPISPMGITVFKKEKDGNWLVGSFSGLYRWNPSKSYYENYFKEEQCREESKKSFVLSRHTICGYTDDTATSIVFDHAKGADLLLQPNELLEKQPMSLWNCALELHVGRCYSPFLGPFSDLFIFISGLVITLILISGFIVSQKLNKHNKTNK